MGGNEGSSKKEEMIVEDEELRVRRAAEGSRASRGARRGDDWRG